MTINIQNNWIYERFGNIASAEKGKKPKTLSYEKQKGFIPYIDIKAFEKKIFQNYTDGVNCRLCEEGDILLVWDGSRSGLVGKAPKGAIGSTIAKIEIPIINKDFVLLFLKSKYEEINARIKGTGTPHVDPNLLWNYKFPIVSPHEQHEIVRRLEAMFSQLLQSVENLKKAREQLKTYRQVVLKKAFEGKLTEEWRRQQTDLEPADKLLEKIKAERQKRYEEQLEEWKKTVKKWEADGKPAKKPKKPQKPKDLTKIAQFNSENLPKLPVNWKWIKVGELTNKVEYGTSQKSKPKGKVPVLRMGNIQNNYFDWSDLVYTDDENEIKKHSLVKYDVLFNRTNSPELVGKSAIFLNEQKAIFAGYLIRVNHFKNQIDSKYLNYFLNSYEAKKYANIVKTDGVNQSNINGEKLMSYPFPLTDKKEQTQIVQEIETRFSVAEKLGKTIEESLQKAESLRQSILKKAFEGELTRQWREKHPKLISGENSAERLLEKIKQEKEKVK